MSGTANLEVMCVRTKGFDGAGQVTAGDKRLGQVHFHHAGTDVRVDGTQSHGADAHEHFTLLPFRSRQVAELEDLRPAGLFKEDCFHRL